MSKASSLTFPGLHFRSQFFPALCNDRHSKWPTHEKSHRRCSEKRDESASHLSLELVFPLRATVLPRAGEAAGSRTKHTHLLTNERQAASTQVKTDKRVWVGFWFWVYLKLHGHTHCIIHSLARKGEVPVMMHLRAFQKTEFAASKIQVVSSMQSSTL